jgi:hypothetical protein
MPTSNNACQRFDTGPLAACIDIPFASVNFTYSLGDTGVQLIRLQHAPLDRPAFVRFRSFHRQYSSHCLDGDSHTLAEAGKAQRSRSPCYLHNGSFHLKL